MLGVVTIPFCLSDAEFMSQIIATHSTSHSTSYWQEAMIQAIRDPRELLEYLQLPMSLLPAAEVAAKEFGLRVPRPFLDRIRKGDLHDPLLQQVLPIKAELNIAEGFSVDPLGEQNSNPKQGLVHKYHGRALLIVAPHCAVNCRYCFRRHFPYQDNNPSRAQWQETLDYLRQDTSLSEVIFSGGDPMAANDRQLQWLVDEISAMQHIRRLRVHTRLPVVIPQRITEEAIAWLSSSRLQTTVVLHANHANELDDKVAHSVALLRRAGIIVLNQAVLLKNINETLQAQIDLSERLFEIGVLPYYLHLLDPVQGAAHFAIVDSEAIALHKAMQASLPGYLVPRLAREETGESQKTLML